MSKQYSRIKRCVASDSMRLMPSGYKAELNSEIEISSILMKLMPSGYK